MFPKLFRLIGTIYALIFIALAVFDFSLNMPLRAMEAGAWGLAGLLFFELIAKLIEREERGKRKDRTYFS